MTASLQVNPHSLIFWKIQPEYAVCMISMQLGNTNAVANVNLRPSGSDATALTTVSRKRTTMAKKQKKTKQKGEM